MAAENFAEYILSEKDWIRKMEIVFYLRKRTGIFYDNSVIFKTLLTKLFIDNFDLGVDKNEVVTASLLWSCKKETTNKDLYASTNQRGKGAAIAAYTARGALGKCSQYTASITVGKNKKKDNC